jgi:hypothetical protein
MGRIFTAVEEFLKSDDWPTQTMEDAGIIKTGFDVEGVDLPAKLDRNLVYANVLTMDRYFSG